MLRLRMRRREPSIKMEVLGRKKRAGQTGVCGDEDKENLGGSPSRRDAHQRAKSQQR